MYNDFSKFKDRPSYNEFMKRIVSFRVVFTALIVALFATLAVEYAIIIGFLVR